MKTKRIFLAATKQNDGKTSASLGLISAFLKKTANVGFIKPVGQRYLIEKGEKIDEDSILIKRVCGLKDSLKDMSPIAVERGFTAKYIEGAKNQALARLVKRSFERVSKDKNLVIIEGTGHAGVGSVFDLSNARVASLLKSKVIIISSGGVGRPIDEVMLSKALFDKEKVDVLGVIINKVLPGKYKKIKRLINLGFKRKGLKVFGVIPYYKMLSRPTVGQILEEEKSIKYLCGKKGLENPVDKVIVGAMEPHEALNYISDNSLIITPGDREDIMLTCMSSHLASGESESSISGIVLTGGIKPHRSILNLIKKTDIPVLVAEEDTYTITSKIHDLIIKVKPRDAEKAEIIKKMVERYVDIDCLYNSI